MKGNYDSWEYLHEEYEKKGRSTKDIAAEHDTYPNTIRRCLKKWGFQVRDKSSAQKQFIENNGGSPLLGRKRTAAEKDAISAGIQVFWEALDPDTKQGMKSRMAEAAKKHWDDLPEREKKESIYKMHLASKSKMYEGSKNENMVAEFLVKAGFKIQQRITANIPGRQFEIDIAIPSLSVAIEWDGATHFLPIYGEQHLEKVMAKDMDKNAMLTSAGWHVIRCRDHSTSNTKAFCNRSVDKIKKAIESLKGSKRTSITYLDME